MPAPVTTKPANMELKPVSPHIIPKTSPNTNSTASASNQGSKSKKEGPLQSPIPNSLKETAQQQQQTSHTQAQVPPKKITRRSSKPIINWFQRKLAGTVRARRASDGDTLRSQRLSGIRTPPVKDKHRRSSVPAVPPLPDLQATRRLSKPQPRPTSINTKRNTLSLDGTDDYSSIVDGHTVDSYSEYRSSYARDSMWSPNSVREADEDASVRPIPPSAPPSPSLSHSSGSYLSDPRTFASMAISTKPTTLLSVDLTGGMAHIAQAPPTPTTVAHRLAPHLRTHSNGPGQSGAISFASLSPISPSRQSSFPQGRGPSYSVPLNAPQHTTHHPRNNPRPSSPPPDDASVLTLASSAFGIPGSRIGVNALAGRTSMADESISHFSAAMHGLGDSTSHFLLGEYDDDRLTTEGDRDGDFDASVRALRPRSSRRGSWESEASGWSARVGVGPSTPGFLRGGSLWTSGSFRTGAVSVDVDNDDEDNGLYKALGLTSGDNPSSSMETDITDLATDSVAPSSDIDSREEDILTPSASVSGHVTSPALATSISQATSKPDSTGAATPKKEAETPKLSTLALEDIPPVPVFVRPHLTEDDRRSTTHTAAFVTAPTTPAAV